jgi:hypothetical protein
VDADALLDAFEDDLIAAGHGSDTYARRLAILRQNHPPHEARRLFLSLYLEELSPSISQRIPELLREVDEA